MGLVLHSPSDSEFLSNLSERRYLTGRAGIGHARQHRRPLSRTQWKSPVLQCEDEDALAQQSGILHDFAQTHHVVTLPSTHSTRQLRESHLHTVQEGLSLAQSDVVLPGDDTYGLPAEQDRGRSRTRARSRSNSPPSLGRQDAFRDSRTTKKTSYRTMTRSAAAALSTVLAKGSPMTTEQDEVEELYRLGLLYDNDDDDVEELYRMGLLYDNEHERGDGFTFDAIVHNEPVYTLNVRPAKRGARRDRRRVVRSPTALSAARSGAMWERSTPTKLSLDLSFTQFTEDGDLAAFLLSPSQSEILTLAAADAEDDLVCFESESKRRRTNSHAIINQPLTVIYELEDRDFSQEEDADVDDLEDGFNNHRSAYYDEDDTWALVDDDNNDEYSSDGNGNCECDAAATLLPQKNTATEHQDTWVHINHCDEAEGLKKEKMEESPTERRSRKYDTGS